MVLVSRLRVTLTVLLVLAASAARPQESGAPLRRGPVESRDEWLLAQPTLTLPALAPDPVGHGRTELRLDGDWGSDFGFEAGPGGRERDLQYLVDGEHRSGAVTVRRGFGPRWTLGFRAVVLWRGRGVLDGVIDGFHEAFDLPDSGRGLYPSGRLRVEGRAMDRRPLSWDGGAGTGLGNVELEAHRSFSGGGRDGWRSAVALRASVPSATGPFSGAGAAAGGQILVARALGARADIYGGIGLLVRSRREYHGLAYPRTRPQAFTALEVRILRAWSVVAQVDGGGRLVEDVEAYPARLAYLRLVTRVGAGRWTVEAGVTEGVVSQAAATDFGVLLGIRKAF
jgi:hypothetical protein